MTIRVSGSAYYTRTTGLVSATAFTAMGWFRIPTLSSWMSFIQIDGTSTYYQLGPNGDGSTYNIQVSGGGSSGPTLVANTWYHCAMVGNASNVLAYLDGALVITGSAHAMTVAKIWLGNSSGGDPLNGNIDSVKIWDAELTLAEIQAERWLRMPQRTLNLNSWYIMQGLGDDEIDYSGNGYTLTVTGTPTVENGPPIPWRQGKTRTVYVPAAAGGGGFFSRYYYDMKVA